MEGTAIVLFFALGGLAMILVIERVVYRLRHGVWPKDDNPFTPIF